jgi:amino acid transporter
MDSKAAGQGLSLVGATGVGVGAIVGGGVLALAGVAFAAAGPSAIVAFALNGLLAALTALSFAELSSRFPQSGGTYVHAKKVLSVEAAFLVGWVVWFASIVAAVLYAVGFAAFAVAGFEGLAEAAGRAAPAALHGRPVALLLALAAVAFHSLGLLRRPAGGGQLATVGKLVVFGALIAAGLWAMLGQPEGANAERLRPFFAGGAGGLLQAMGYTVIALQGFDLVAAVGGEVRDPVRNVPRAMLLSLGVALLVYLPLLLVTSTVGTPAGTTIRQLAAEDPATVIALAARGYLGAPGYWRGVVAGLLAMISALQANLFAASRVALAMARDRTLPEPLARVSAAGGTPRAAVVVTSIAVLVLLVVLPDVAAAGAAASLIFLVAFALAHATSVLARRRSGRPAPFAVPLFPLVPVAGALACVALALFQGFAVPAAGAVTGIWLLAGLALYVAVLAPRARTVDASAEAHDPDLAQLRGHASLVLVPIANPASTRALVGLASALTAPPIGRVLLLSVVRPPGRWRPGEMPPQLIDAQRVLGEALTESFALERTPEALVTISATPWQEIGRVARVHRCDSIVLGLPKLDEARLASDVEALASGLDCDVVVLRAQPGWRAGEARRILVPLGGRRDQSEVRARLLSHLQRSSPREITYSCALSPTASEAEIRRVRSELERLARDEVPAPASVEVVRADDVVAALARRSEDHDLVVLGMQRPRRRRKVFGTVPLQLARETACPLIIVGQRG